MCTCVDFRQERATTTRTILFLFLSTIPTRWHLTKGPFGDFIVTNVCVHYLHAFEFVTCHSLIANKLLILFLEIRFSRFLYIMGVIAHPIYLCILVWQCIVDPRCKLITQLTKISIIKNYSKFNNSHTLV